MLYIKMLFYSLGPTPATSRCKSNPNFQTQSISHHKLFFSAKFEPGLISSPYWSKMALLLLCTNLNFVYPRIFKRAYLVSVSFCWVPHAFFRFSKSNSPFIYSCTVKSLVWNERVPKQRLYINIWTVQTVESLYLFEVLIITAWFAITIENYAKYFKNM